MEYFFTLYNVPVESESRLVGIANRLNGCVLQEDMFTIYGDYDQVVRLYKRITPIIPAHSSVRRDIPVSKNLTFRYRWDSGVEVRIPKGA